MINTSFPRIALLHLIAIGWLISTVQKPFTFIVTININLSTRTGGHGENCCYLIQILHSAGIFKKVEFH